MGCPLLESNSQLLQATFSNLNVLIEEESYANYKTPYLMSLMMLVNGRNYNITGTIDLIDLLCCIDCVTVSYITANCFISLFYPVVIYCRSSAGLAQFDFFFFNQLATAILTDLPFWRT